MNRDLGHHIADDLVAHAPSLGTDPQAADPRPPHGDASKKTLLDQVADDLSKNPLPSHREAQVAAGLATYQSVLAERDTLDAKLSDACKTIASLTVQLDALRSVVNMMESSYTSARLELENRVREYQAQRDDAVRAAAKADAVVENIYVVAHNAIEEAKNVRG